MNTNKLIDLALYTRIYAVSISKYTDASALLPWAIEANLPKEACVDFISPNALHNISTTALHIGQSFRKKGKVLFINMDNDPAVATLIERVQEYEACNMQLSEVVLIDGTFRYTNDLETKYKCVWKSEDEPNEMNQKDHYLDPLKTLTWDEAKALLHRGAGSVRRLSMPPTSFVGFNKGKVLEAEKFWVRENVQAAKRNGGFLNVLPYYTFCDGENVDMAWRPTMEDEMATDWISGDLFLTLLAFEETPSGRYKATYMLQPGTLTTAGKVLFPIYGLVAGKDPTPVKVYTGDMGTADVILSLITDMKDKLYSTKGEVVADSLLEAGSCSPCMENLVVGTTTCPGMYSNKGEYFVEDIWNRESILNDIKKDLIENPDQVIIIDVKGFSDDEAVNAELGREAANDNAVNLVNYLREELTKFCHDKPCMWFIIDLDYEANQEL